MSAAADSTPANSTTAPSSFPPDLVEFLLDSARYGDTEDIRTVLKEHPQIVHASDESHRTALHMASANGHYPIVLLLLAAGANVSAKNDQDSTPLHWACLNGQNQVALALLKAGASPSALSKQGRTPVDEALSRDHLNLVREINDFTGVQPIEDETDDVEEGGEAEEMVLTEGDMMGEGEDELDQGQV